MGAGLSVRHRSLRALLPCHACLDEVQEMDLATHNEQRTTRIMRRKDKALRVDR